MKRLYPFLAVVSGTVIVGLVAIAALDLDQGNRVASVIAAVVAILALLVSIVQMTRQPATKTEVQSEGANALAAGGDVAGNAIGDHSTVFGTASSSPRQTTTNPTASNSEGQGSIAAGGSILDNAIGDGSVRKRTGRP